VLKIDPSSEVEKISEKVQVKGTKDHTYPTRHEKPVKRRESSVLPENILTFTRKTVQDGRRTYRYESRTVSALTLAMVLFKHVGG
jgi:hypothetical protein